MSLYILTKMVKFSNGNGAEMSWCVQGAATCEEDDAPYHLPDPDKEFLRKYNRTYHDGYAEGSQERALRRVKQAVRYRVREHALDHLVTLTTRANLDDFDDSQAMVQEFVKLVHVHLPEWKYVMVPERQERGAWHWHLAAHGWQPLGILREAWDKVCKGKGGGNVDVQGPGKKGGRSTTYRWHPGRLAGYLCKYITKELEERPLDMKGRHRYMASLGLRTWDVTHNAFSIETELADLLVFFNQCNAGGISRIWEDKEKGIGWVT
jgi:hypothetical protein